MKTVALLCFLTACTFQAPYNPHAREECYRYADEINIKGQVCGFSAEHINSIVEDIGTHCATVTIIDTFETPDQCIDRLWEASCEELPTLRRCYAFW